MTRQGDGTSSGRATTDPPGLVPGQSWVSPLNYESEAREGFAFPQPLTVFDSTIRKLLYTPGAAVDTADLLPIAEALARAGIVQELLNVHWWGSANPDSLEQEASRTLLAGDTGLDITVYTDALVSLPTYGPEPATPPAGKIVHHLRELGARRIGIVAVPRPDAGTRARQAEELEEAFELVRGADAGAVLCVGDSARMPFADLVDILRVGLRGGAERIDLTDPFGSTTPEAMKLFVRRCVAEVPADVPVTMHVHDDFGMATAGALAASTAGAHPDVSVNGLSYRAGFAALEEVVVALELLYGVGTGVELGALQELSRLVAASAGLPEQPLKPVTGEHAYLYDLPMWQLPYLRGGREAFPPTASCYVPATVGAQPTMVWTVHGTDGVVREKLRAMRLADDAATVAEVRRRIDALLGDRVSYPRWVPEDDVAAVCLEVAGQVDPRGGPGA